MVVNTRTNPDKRIEFINCVEKDDCVVVHSKVEFPSKKMVLSVMHIFRFENDKIVKMWDVGQLIPDVIPNENGAF